MSSGCLLENFCLGQESYILKPPADGVRVEQKLCIRGLGAVTINDLDIVVLASPVHFRTQEFVDIPSEKMFPQGRSTPVAQTGGFAGDGRTMSRSIKDEPDSKQGVWRIEVAAGTAHFRAVVAEIVTIVVC